MSSVEPQDLDPHRVNGNPEGHIIRSLLEGLVSHDQQTRQILPGIAERWRLSDDKLTYRFTLRKNAHWSDNEPVTCEDFFYSWFRLLSPKFGSPNAQLAFSIKGAKNYYLGGGQNPEKVGIQCTNPHELAVTLENPSPFFLDLVDHYAFYPVRKKTIEAHGDQWTKPEHFVGNGPFTMKSWESMKRIALKKSETYWDKKAVKLDGIDFMIGDTPDTEEALFRVGKLDLADIPLEKIGSWRTKPEYLESLANGIAFYRINIEKPAVSDPKLRRALALAVDRERIVKFVTRANQEPLYQYVPPFLMKAKVEHALTKGPAALAEAKRLLKEAGYGAQKPLPTIEILINKSDLHSAIAEAIQHMWQKELGVTAKIRNIEWKVFMDTIRVKDYEMARTNWLMDYTDPQAYLESWLSTNPDNVTGYKNPEFDSLFAAALAEKDVDKRRKTWARAESLVLAEMPLIPLYVTKLYGLKAKRVRNFRLNPQGTMNFKLVDLAP